jgi:hypothetical protein
MSMSRPILRFFSHLSAILLLTMLPLSAHTANDLLLEADIAPSEVRVQEQAVYRLRSLHASEAGEVTISPPSVRLADLREIGEERVYETWRGKRRYHVHERSYAVFPFAGGTLALSGASVTVPATKSPVARPAMRLEAPMRHLTVLPIPTVADGAPWLPANALTLSETWSPADGKSQRRTIRIEAIGIDAAHLPALQITGEDITVQAETPHVENRFAGEQNVGIREQSFIITPTHSGLVVVPELLLHWWNVRADLPSLAMLPAHTLHTAAPSDSADDDSAAAGTMTWIILATLMLYALLLSAWQQRKRLHIMIAKLRKRGIAADTAVL